MWVRLPHQMRSKSVRQSLNWAGPKIRTGPWRISIAAQAIQFALRSSSTPRFTCSLSGSPAAAAILVESARPDITEPHRVGPLCARSGHRRLPGQTLAGVTNTTRSSTGVIAPRDARNQRDSRSASTSPWQEQNVGRAAAAAPTAAAPTAAAPTPTAAP